jgi:hypothetical protein
MYVCMYVHHLPLREQRVVVGGVCAVVLEPGEVLGDAAVAGVEQHDDQRVQHHGHEGEHQGVGAACGREGGA